MAQKATGQKFVTLIFGKPETKKHFAFPLFNDENRGESKMAEDIGK